MKFKLIFCLLSFSMFFIGQKYMLYTYPVKLIKVWDNTVFPFERGEEFEMARVEEMSLCLSIAQAYNFARENENSLGGDFGTSSKDYHFQCTK